MHWTLCPHLEHHPATVSFLEISTVHPTARTRISRVGLGLTWVALVFTPGLGLMLPTSLPGLTALTFHLDQREVYPPLYINSWLVSLRSAGFHLPSKLPAPSSRFCHASTLPAVVVTRFLKSTDFLFLDSIYSEREHAPHCDKWKKTPSLHG